MIYRSLLLFLCVSIGCLHPTFAATQESVFQLKSTAQQRELQKKLDANVSLDLQEANIKDVLKILSMKGDLNIISDNTLSGTLDVSLTDVPLRDAIDFILKTQGLSYKIVDNTILIANGSNLAVPTRLKTQVIRLNHVPVQDAITIIEKQLSPLESVEPFEQENMLVLHVAEDKVADIQQLVHQLDDRQLPQILLEARIVETSSTALDQLGMSWATSIPLNYTMQLSDGTFSGKSESSIFTVLNVLSEKGDAKILASPRIKAIHNQEATIFIGDKIPYIEITTDTSGRITEAVKYVDAGITLVIHPEINRDTQEIKIKVDPEVSYINGFRGKFNDIPIVRTRKVSTTVRVKNGETVIIGGLFNSSDSDSLSKVPIIGDIPLLGQFFSSGKDSGDDTELLITITPKIVDEYDRFEPTTNLSVKADLGLGKK